MEIRTPSFLAGFKCPSGSPRPEPCQPGEYQDKEESSSCLPCPAGRVCEGQNGTQPQACPPGSYCEGGSTLLSKGTCPSHTFNPAENATDRSWCLECPDGYLCDGEGLVNITLCPAGQFCKSSLEGPQPCQKGFFCPEGATEPWPCRMSYACSKPELSAPKEKCASGFFCNRLSTDVRPLDFDGLQVGKHFYSVLSEAFCVRLLVLCCFASGKDKDVCVLRT